MDIFQYGFNVAPVVVDPVCFIIVAVAEPAFPSSQEQGPGEGEVFDFFSLTGSRAKSSMAAQDCHYQGGQT